ncbi:MAG: S8 family serine peptidase, partial [Anaerolineales bacterium]
MSKTHRILRALLPLVLLLSLAAATAGPQFASQVKAHPLLLQIADEHPEQQVAVIVQKLGQDTRLESRVVQLGGEVTKDLYLINAFAARLAAGKAVELAMDPYVRWVSLDAPVLEVSGTEAENVVSLRADFNQPDFQGLDSNWNQTWLEIGEADGAEAGDVLISSFLGGSAQGVRLQGKGKGLQSVIDLSQTNAGTMSFSYRRKGFSSETEYVAVEISTNGGLDWFEVYRIGGLGTDPVLNFASVDLAPYLPGELHLRFISSPDFAETSRFYLDYVEVDFQVQLKPEPELPYKVSLPLVVNTNPYAEPQMDNGLLGMLYDYSKTVRDEFTAGTFGENDGTNQWAGPWIENDVAGSGPAGGGVAISGGELRLMDSPDTNTEPSLAREVNLSSAIAAVFSFDYHTSHGVDPDDTVVVDVSKDGGQSYTKLQTYTGISGQTWGSGHFDLTQYLSANTRIRFRVSSKYGGSDEFFIVDNVQIAYAPLLGETVRDEFTQISYENNHGTLPWGNAWVEYDGGGPYSGYIKIGSLGRLNFHYLWGEFIQRSVNLSGSSHAVLSLDWQTVGLDEGEKLSIKISAGGGAPFVEIGALVGNQTGSFSYDISPYISPNTMIRLGNSAEYWEYGEYTYIDNLQIAFESDCPDCFPTKDLKSTFAQSIGADVLWNESNYLQGQGVTIAVVDSGISPHADFLDRNGQSRILTQVDFVTPGLVLDDFYGHGTHVAGSAAGNGAASGGIYPGVAPQANLVDVKVMDDLGIGTTSSVVEGLQWVYENKDLYNIRIVNLSLNSTVSESYHTSALDAALEVLWFNGIVVVVSAGNNGTSASGVVFPPANDPFVITVGAVDDMGTRDTSDDVLASF